jgi:hypothetical protein
MWKRSRVDPRVPLKKQGGASQAVERSLAEESHGIPFDKIQGLLQ